MDFAVSPMGLVVHCRKDWPCAVCRPKHIFDGEGQPICSACAHNLLASAGIHVAGGHELLEDITEALVLLEGEPRADTVAVN